MHLQNWKRLVIGGLGNDGGRGYCSDVVGGSSGSAGGCGMVVVLLSSGGGDVVAVLIRQKLFANHSFFVDLGKMVSHQKVKNKKIQNLVRRKPSVW